MYYPTGTVTFLFTDIEGSTRQWEAHPEAMRRSVARHDEIMRRAIEGNGGIVFKTIGDAFCGAFATAPSALAAAVDGQKSLAEEKWPDPIAIRVRMAAHTGSAEFRNEDYFGQPLNRVARLLSTGHGGQTLLSEVVYELVRDTPPAQVTFKSLGEHRLKDLGRPEPIFQVNSPGLPSEFPPIRSLNNPDLKHNLPQQLTSFVGREEAIREMGELLEKNRLVTLTGAGGCGKTRLALQVAADRVDVEADGVWLVELAPISDPNLVPQTLASVLGMKEEPGKSVSETLVENLRAKDMVILLDNCEHLLDTCAKLADDLVRHCPKVLVLATSREALGIAGERSYRVPSLSSPNPDVDKTPESLSHFESVRLFIDRAQFHQSSFTVDAQNAPAVAAVCYRLDGIPLALELAAARLRSMSVEEVNQRLDQRFRLLTGGSRTALPRQQTLRSLIDWSHDLLNEKEKALLARLSVFSGGWTLEAAEAICSDRTMEGTDASRIDPLEVLDLLDSLVEKSLVVWDAEKGRYRLLETVRQYAADRAVDSGDAEEWRDRHLNSFAKLGLEAADQERSAFRVEWFDRLEADHDNIRAALRWSLTDPTRVERGVELAGGLCRFWRNRGYPDGTEWLPKLLDFASPVDSVARANVMRGLCFIQVNYGALTEAEATARESLAISERIGDHRGLVYCYDLLGQIGNMRGDYEWARGELNRDWPSRASIATTLVFPDS